MADVEKLNINNTDYDIADAKALRNKDTVGTGSFVDTRAGTTQYPTTEAHTDSLILGKDAHVRGGSARAGLTILGNGAYANMSYNTIIGNMAHSNGSMATSVGYNANAGGNQATAIGSNASANAVLGIAIGSGASLNSGSYSIIIGSGSGLSGNSSIVMGYSTSVASDYSIALVRGATVGSRSNYSIAVGYNATVNDYCSQSIALGNNARATATYAAQLGEGTNGNYGSLQFRSWQLLDSNGKIPSERFGLTTMDTAYPMNLYSLSDEERAHKGMFYTGQTCDALKQDVIYQSAVQYSHPRAECTYVSSDALPGTNHVIIDQEKFFLKCAEISKQRIDNNDTRNSFVGGDNSSQDMCFYYDKASEQWHIEFGSDSFEGNQTPDNVENITPADFGIYCPGLNLDWMDSDATEEIFDINYYAPCYCDSYDYGDSGLFYIDYMKLMNSMSDSDWGFGKVIDEISTWDYTVDGTYYDMPIIPQSYISKVDGNEWDSVEVRWEWDDNDGKWIEYINGNASGYSWTTASMESQFGITIESGEESNLEYIGITFRGAEQRYWTKIINKEDFATTQSINNLQSALNVDEENKMFKRFQSARDLNTMTTAGQYRIEAIGSSNLPTQASGARYFWLFVTNFANNGTEVRQVLIADKVSMSAGGGGYTRYAPNIFVRCRLDNIWSLWKPLLTDEASPWIQGFKRDTKQMLVHNSNNNTMVWEEGSGGNAEWGSIGGTLSDQTDLQSALDGKVNTTDLTTLLNEIYPVGSIYIGTQNTCPMSVVISGSTWELVSSGRALWTGNGTNANTTIAAGLPNVTGSASSNSQWDMASGVFVGYQDTSHKYRNNNASGYGYGYDFNASRSNSIYGNSTTVQPPAYVVNVWRRTA